MGYGWLWQGYTWFLSFLYFPRITRINTNYGASAARLVAGACQSAARSRRSLNRRNQAQLDAHRSPETTRISTTCAATPLEPQKVHLTPPSLPSASKDTLLYLDTKKGLQKPIRSCSRFYKLQYQARGYLVRSLALILSVLGLIVDSSTN